MATTTVSPVCALLTVRCTPELEQVQAELGARTSFRDAVRIRTHAVALGIEADDRHAAAELTAVRDEPAKAVAADASWPVVMLDGAYIRV